MASSSEQPGPWLELDELDESDDNDSIESAVSVTYTIDELLVRFGEFGRFQVLQLGIASLSWIVGAAHVMIMVFINEASGCPTSSSVDELPRTIAVEWGLVCDHEWKLGVAGTSLFAGWFVGAGAFGTLSDRKGRRVGMISSICLLLVASFFTVLAPWFSLYIVLRFAVGAAIGGLSLASFVSCTEFFGPKYRPHVACLLSGAFAVGIMILAPVAFAISSWRYLTAATVAMTVLLLAMYPWMYETPRWLQARGQISEAKVLMVKIANFNCCRTKIPTKWNIKRLSAPNHAREVKIEAENPPPSSQKIKSKIGVTTLFLVPALRRNILVMMYAWLVNSLVYYGLSLNTGNLGGSIYFNAFLSGLVELPSYALVTHLLGAWGRQKTLVAAMGIASAMCIIYFLLPQSAVMARVALALAMVGKFAIAGSFAVLYLYSAELFPTRIRNTAMGICSQASRIGGIIAPLALALLAQISIKLPVLIFGLACLGGAGLALVLPETLNKPLPETVEEYPNS